MRDSWLRCPNDGKRLAIDAGQEEGQGLVNHECLHCGYHLQAPSTRQPNTGSPFLGALKQRAWAE